MYAAQQLNPKPNPRSGFTLVPTQLQNVPENLPDYQVLSPHIIHGRSISPTKKKTSYRDGGDQLGEDKGKGKGSACAGLTLVQCG